LPVYGIKTYGTKVVKGKEVQDSIDYTVPGFSLIDQDSNNINQATTAGKIYVADFFFTSCPSICPPMKRQMLRIYDKYQNNNEVVLLSYSIDPKRDTVQKLRKYADKLGITNTEKWHFLTGNKDSIYSLAESYLVSAAEDPDAPGGHIHDGNFILIDKHKRIRGYYDGTNAESVDKLLKDMDTLLKENTDE
jgi:protein SCO1/2